MDALAHSKVPRLLVLLSSIVGLAGCDLFGFGPVCTSEPRPGIRVVLVDASSGAPVGGSGVTVVASDGAAVDTVDAVSVSGVAFLMVGKGAYRVDVTVPGYARWTQEGVEVREDQCGPVATEIEARLVPEG